MGRGVGNIAYEAIMLESRFQDPICDFFEKGVGTINRNLERLWRIEGHVPPPFANELS